MTSFRIAPIVIIGLIIVLAAVLYFAVIPAIQGATAGPQSTVQGIVLYKTIAGNGGTVAVVDEVNKDTKTLTIQNNQDFNSIQQFKRYSFNVRGQAVMNYQAI